MKTARFILLVAFLFIIVNCATAQQMSSWEIKWNFYGYRQEGLMIMAGNIGTFRVKCFNRNTGELLDIVDQYVKAKRVRDGVVLNCYSPTTHNGTSYSADNFKIFKDGSMYMLDDAGSWSTEITMREITETYDLLRMKRKYGL